jgi:putative ABC transport system permease protein
MARSKVRVDVVEGGRIAVRSLAVNRLRTVLTTVGIGIGVATLLAIVGIIQGLNQAFTNQLASLGSNTLFVAKFPIFMGGNWWQYRNRKDFTLANIEQIRALSSYVDAMAPVARRMTEVEYRGEVASPVVITGTTDEYLRTSGFDITEGRFIAASDNEVQRAVAVLGMDVVDRFFPNRSPLGATIRIDDKPFQVIGTLSRKGKFGPESMDNNIIIPFKTFAAKLGSRRPFTIAIAVTSGDVLNVAEDQLVGILRRIRRTPPEKPDDFFISRPEQLADTYNKLTGALYGVAVGVGFITLLVGGIGIMNIMLVSVRERTREIGIRRALGARRRTIVLQFLMEAAAVSAVGGALGTAVGLGTAYVISQITPLAAAVEPLTVLFGVGFAAAVGLLFGIWPAARAANLDPIESLRYE